MSLPTALIVDDDSDFRASIIALCSREAYETVEAGTLKEAREVAARTRPDVVLLDLVLPDGRGLDLVQDDDLAEHAEFVIMTGHANLESAIAALRDGALDYLTKPVDRPRLQSILANVARTRVLKNEVSELRAELRDIGRFGSMIGRSDSMQRVYDLISRVAPTESTVFITGESGTGKELVAETIHRLSKRRKGPFLALNCGAVSSGLIESELFGHEKGSFTGADRRRLGYFEEAAGGTLLLDEITEMPIDLQPTLLRALETGTITRVGATAPTETDVRVIAASNRDPIQAVGNGKLREDLHYRLSVFPIELPPLRERGQDIELLSRFFLDQVNRRDATSKRLSDDVVNRLSDMAWPGNVRELKNVIERAAILADDVIGLDLIPDSATTRDQVEDATSVLRVRIGSPIEEVERRLILATLEELEGDKRRAAKTLGISLKTLYNRLKIYRAREQP